MSHESASPLVRALIAAVEAEEQLLALLADAVKRGNREEVFRLAAQLTGIDPENGSTTLHPQPKTQNKP